MDSRDNRRRANGGGHVLVVPYPSQGHINPMLQFSKRLASKGLRATLAITRFISTTMNPRPSSMVHLDTISDGHDEGGFSQADTIHSYLSRLESAGSDTLSGLILKYKDTDHPVDCIIYDSFLPWALDVARKFSILGAVFFTQSCAVDYIYYLVHHGILKLPIPAFPVSIPGLPSLELRDMPSFIYRAGSYPAYFEMVLHQFLNADKADWVLVNTFYKLEAEVTDTMSKECPLMTIGPTIPSIYLDKRLDDDTDYRLHLFELDSSNITSWLESKPPGSVIYVSFGSMAVLSSEQMEELAWGIHDSGHPFLWVVRASEESKIPEKFKGTISPEHALLVQWGRQLEILSSNRIGCFFSHAGWNSTIEALSLGVPMVVMPQWTDQTTDAKLVEDLWEVGVRVRVGEDGIVRREEIKRCIREVMEGERRGVIAEKARMWKDLAVEAVSDGGTSDTNINDFVSKIALKTS